MNLTILNVISIICWAILGLFCSKINIKSFAFLYAISNYCSYSGDRSISWIL
nr:MAG TPA: hypothetical protein [Caudoviricetes sp.]